MSKLQINTINKITSGITTVQQAWPQLVYASAMLLSMILWPTLTKLFNKKLREETQKELIEKYTHYLNEKRKELTLESKLQKDILIENLIPVEHREEFYQMCENHCLLDTQMAEETYVQGFMTGMRLAVEALYEDKI